MELRIIEQAEALELIDRDESHFWDHKSSRAKGVALQKIAAGLGNADGGEFAVGIEDRATGLGPRQVGRLRHD